MQGSQIQAEQSSSLQGEQLQLHIMFSLKLQKTPLTAIENINLI